MIRKTWNSDKWLLTSQPEHARLAAIIGSAWNFPDGKPCDEVFKALISHDDGWKEADAIPSIKANGDPLSFHETHLVDAVPIYDRSIASKKESGQLYATALITGHFLCLAESADLGRASIQDAIISGQFLARQRQHLSQLKEEISKDEAGLKQLENFDKDLRFLQVCDYISLLLCTDFTGEETIENIPYLANGTIIKVSRKNSSLALLLDPLPFKKNVRDHLTSWIVPFIPYESSKELLAAMEEVKTVVNEVHLGNG